MNKKAFTLIEVLIALFIFAIMALIATGVLHHAITIKATLADKQSVLIKRQFISTRIKNALSHAVDYSGLNASEPFMGSDHAIKFTEVSDKSEGNYLYPIIRKVNIVLKDNQLIEQFDNGAKITLADAVNKFSVSYQDCQGNRVTTWQNTLDDDSSRHLPCVVTVEVRQPSLDTHVVVAMIGGNVE